MRDTSVDVRIDEFRDFVTSTEAARALAERCRDYKNGEQLSEEELKALKKRKQPPVVDNKIQDKVDTLIGVEQQTRTDPKAYPRTPAHEDAADAATDALRYIKDDSAFTETATAAFDNLVVEGLCAGEVIVEKRKGKPPRVKMNRIRWDRCYYDPHSLELDYSDARYKGFFNWMDLEAAKRLFPKKDEVLELCFSDESLSISRTFEDIPRLSVISGKRRRLQIFTTYFLEGGEWHRCVWCVGGYLEGPEVSAYKDEDGAPDCAIELQAVYKDRDGNPFGSVKRWLDLQDEHNKRRSKMLHLLNTKQLIAEEGAFTDINKARAELHKPDGVLQPVPGFKWDVQTHLDLATGQFQLLQYTDAQLSATGPNAALMGQTGSLSGRAKQLDQQAGSLMIAPLTNAARSWKLRMYRHAWNRVRQYWTAEMWIRVTDNEENVRFVGLNQPVMQGDVVAESLRDQALPPDEKRAVIERIAADPAMRLPYVENGRPKIKNNVAEMDVDIIIDESPDTITVQSEEFAQLVELAKSGAVQIPPKALIAASQLRSQTKKQMLDEMSGSNDPAAQQAAQLQQQQIMLEMEKLAAEVEKIRSEAAKNQAATIESGIDASIKTANAQEPTTTQVTVN